MRVTFSLGEKAGGVGEVVGGGIKPGGHGREGIGNFLDLPGAI